MAKEYWIGDFYIDLSRNQITQNGESKQLAPKTLALLTYLAKKHHEVVSQDELLNEVWPGSVVSPNTVQRSIAHLRKALGDDGRAQGYIKTHSKRGYSLECDVHWQSGHREYNEQDKVLNKDQTKNATLTNNLSADTTTKITTELSVSSRKFTLSAIAVVILVLIVAIFKLVNFEQATVLDITEIRALTATENREVAGIYSPNGKYIVFHRYSNEFCSSNIWAKDIKTQEEFQLTQNVSSYGSHSFSKDGNSLVFVQSQTCVEPLTQKQCYHLMSIDFNKALTSPQIPKLLLECKNSKIRKPQWLDNNKIAFLQNTSQRWKLITYSIADKNSDTIYQIDDGNIVSFDYSMERGVFALFSIQKNGKYYIEIINQNGELISSNRIVYPPEIASHKLINPKFSSLADQLIFSTGRQLFTLTFDGQVSKVSLPLDEPIGTPVFHPEQNRMLAIKGQYDSDIVSIPLDSFPTSDVSSKLYTVLDRSLAEESNGIFQPNSNLIGFKSARSGQTQIWTTDTTKMTQLSNFPNDTYLYEVHWSADGKNLLANVDNILTQIFLNGNEKIYSFDFPIIRLFDWSSEHQTALALVRKEGILKFAELNLSSAMVNILNENRITWARKTKDGSIIYTDHLDRFWRTGPVEDKMIERLENQGSKKRFVINDNTIYGINDDFQLWSYVIDNDKYTVVGDVPQNIEYLTDVSGKDVLMTLGLVSRKEVIELLLAN